MRNISSYSENDIFKSKTNNEGETISKQEKMAALTAMVCFHAGM